MTKRSSSENNNEALSWDGFGNTIGAQVTGTAPAKAIAIALRGGGVIWGIGKLRRKEGGGRVRGERGRSKGVDGRNSGRGARALGRETEEGGRAGMGVQVSGGDKMGCN